MGGQAVCKALFVIANGEQVLTGILPTSVLHQKNAMNFIVFWRTHSLYFMFYHLSILD